MLKFLYTILTDPLGLPIAPLWEDLILIIVGEIVHEIAFFVSPGGTFGSLIYWVTKLFVFVVMWTILYGIIAAINFVVLYWIWFTIGGSLLLVGTILWLTLYKKKKRGEKCNQQENI